MSATWASARPRTAVRYASALLCTVGLAAVGAAPVARACGFHDPASVNLGMLNLAYPDALHVRTAIWMAQRDAIVPRDGRASPSDPSSVEFRLEAMRRYRDAVAGLDALRERMTPMDGTPRFAVVLIGSMLWTRFEPSGGRVAMTPHATGPLPDDVVVVTDAPVVLALLDGTLTPAEAQARGLVRLYGPTRPRAGVASLLDRLRPAPRAGARADDPLRST
ncbi:MAG: hypothetical protein ACK54X_08235 [Burkholderiales bacterium]